MGQIRRILLHGLLVAGLWAAALPASAVEATLVADAHVNSARPAVNSGAISNLNVGGGYTALLQFDLSMLPAGTTAAQVSRATLRLYCNRMDTAGSVSVQPVNGSWGEYSVTYGTLPALGSAAKTVLVGQAGVYVVVDVTGLVQGWVSAPTTNNGVALTTGTAVVQFDSKENDLTGHAAVLDVALASSGATGATGATGPAGPAGPTGATGATGPIGPAGPAGAPGLSFQGAYAVALTYALDDVVTYSGSSFISLTGGNKGNTPGLTPQWAVLAQAGTGSSGGGTAGLAYVGTYAATTTYALNDVVTYQGSSYVSLIAANRGSTPGVSPGQWGVLALGAVGVQGPAGPAGAQGPAGPQGLPGQAGVAGTVGPPGATGATGPQGPPVANYTGNYVSTTNYALHDAVSFNGSTYVSLVTGNVGNAPSSSPSQWALLAAQGAAGPAGAAGPPGPVGATGPTGVAGAVGPQGPPVSFQGGWLAGTTYPVGSAVSFGGSSYIALVANSGREPDVSSTFWGLLAQAGAAGAAGATGLQGPTGFPGPQGVAGPTGPTGSAGAAGLTGATGPAGPQGAAGLAVVAGPAGMVYRGNYSSSTNYGLNDAVSFLGSSYISVAASNVGNTPNANPSVWSLLAAQGAAGAAGATGATGAQGTAGVQGPQGVAGPAGPAGAVGVTYRGQWGVAATYHTNDVVSFGGSTYLAMTGSVGSEPDLSPSVWAVLAQNGSAGATGPAGAAATVSVGTVTTGAAGTQASVTNVGSGSAAVLNFTIPQGAAGASGTGGGGGGAGTSGIPFASIYHSVSFNLLFHSVNSSTDAATETDAVLTWVPAGCTATQLSVFSRETTNTVNVILRQGTPGSMANTSLACTVAPGASCTQEGNVTVAAGTFVDFTVTGASGTATGMWMALACN
jgi:hypothetical protein